MSPNETNQASKVLKPMKLQDALQLPQTLPDGRVVGRVDKVEFTQDGSGNQWTTISGTEYATYWDIRTKDWVEGDVVTFLASSCPLHYGNPPVPHAAKLEKFDLDMLQSELDESRKPQPESVQLVLLQDKSVSTVRLTHSFHGHRDLFYVAPLDVDGDRWKLRCAEPGKQGVHTWIDKADLLAKIKEQRKQLETSNSAHLSKALTQLQSVIDWTEDDHDMPSDGAAKLEWYARRLSLIRNAARTGLAVPHLERTDVEHNPEQTGR